MIFKETGLPEIDAIVHALNQSGRVERIQDAINNAALEWPRWTEEQIAKAKQEGMALWEHLNGEEANDAD